MNGSELLLVRLCVACEQLELLAKAASCISYCSCRSSSVKIIAACDVSRPMILGGDDGEQLMAVTTKESSEADCRLTDAPRSEPAHGRNTTWEFRRTRVRRARAPRLRACALHLPQAFSKCCNQAAQNSVRAGLIIAGL